MKEHEPISDWKNFAEIGGSRILRKVLNFVPYCMASHPTRKQTSYDVKVRVLMCKLFDIWYLHCGEYHIVCYCPEGLSLLAMSDAHIHKKMLSYLNLMFSCTTCLFLGTLKKLRKAIISCVMSVCPSELNNSASTERNFTKFGVLIFFENLSRKFKFH